MKKSLLLTSLALLLASCGGNEYASLSVNTEGISESQAFVREFLESRVAERTGKPSSGKVFEVRYSVDPSLDEEHALVEVGRDGASISASTTRALIFGTGKLLRAMTFREGGFSIAPGRYDFKPAPASKYRCCYMARHYNTWYQRAPKEEMLRYIDDMFLLGINALTTQLGMSTVNYAYSTEEERAIFDETTDAICERIRKYGVFLQTGGGNNTARAGYPPQFKAEKLVPSRGDDSWNLCPSKPGALEYLLANRERTLKKYVEKGYPITNMGYFPYDEGGCQCKDCAPWGGNGYVRTIQAMHELNTKYFPDVKETVSCWFFDDADFEGLFKWLETQDWVDFLEIDSHGDFPRYPLEHKIPKDIPVNTFPEISMWGRCPWGGYGATALAGRFERLYRHVQSIAGGFRLYSEGLYDDINKFVITRLYTEPSLSKREILEEYASYELPGVKPKDFVRFANLLETTHLTGDKKGVRRKDFNFLVYLRDAGDKTLNLRHRQAAKALRLAQKMDRDILPTMRDCWRWRQLMLRAIIDNEIFTSRSLHTEKADECYKELVRMYHGEAQLKRLMEDHKDGYTLPPYIPQVQMPAPEGSGIYDGRDLDNGI